MRIERLDEPAHVRAFEFLRQIHEHPDRRHRVLHLRALSRTWMGNRNPRTPTLSIRSSR